jgi:hypothetical protein
VLDRRALSRPTAETAELHAGRFNPPVLLSTRPVLRIEMPRYQNLGAEFDILRASRANRLFLHRTFLCLPYSPGPAKLLFFGARRYRNLDGPTSAAGGRKTRFHFDVILQPLT